MVALTGKLFFDDFNRMLKTLFVLIAVVVISGECSATEKPGTCPHEVDHLNIRGYRTLNNECITVVSRLQLYRKTNYSQLSKTHLENAQRYCETEFKFGSLVLYHTKSIDGLNFADLISEQEVSDSWTAFTCIHKPYANCILKGQDKCVLTEGDNCLWEYKIESIVPEEQPYGKGCDWKIIEKRPCECPLCMNTEWESWKEYKMVDGKFLQTRYRPFDKMPLHSCSSNSAFCCAEHRTEENLAKDRIGCLNGGLMTKEYNCGCPTGYTGLFCELKVTSNYNINVFSKMTAKDSTLLIWLLIFSIFLTILLGISKIIKCFLSREGKRKKHVIINIGDSIRTDQNDYTESPYSNDDDDDSSVSVEAKNVPSRRASPIKTIVKGCGNHICRGNYGIKLQNVCARMASKRRQYPRNVGPRGMTIASPIVYHL